MKFSVMQPWWVAIIDEVAGLKSNATRDARATVGKGGRNFEKSTCTGYDVGWSGVSGQAVQPAPLASLKLSMAV